MVKDSTTYTLQNGHGTIRRQEGNELPEDVNQQLRDAVWAGLAQKLQKDREILCKKNGHQWINGPSNTMICTRCKEQKMSTDDGG